MKQKLFFALLTLAALVAKAQYPIETEMQNDTAKSDTVAAQPVDTNIIFSAVGGLDIKSLAEEVVSKKLDVMVLPQLHKIIWDPSKRGV